MSAAVPLAALLDELVDARSRIRSDRAPADLQAIVRAGIEAWEAAIATVDSGGTAEHALATVTGLFTVDEETRRTTRTAEDMVRMGVSTPEHRFMAGLVAVRQALVKANQPAIALLRKAVALERRSHSRWRGTEGRAAAMVDRDLKLEEVRVAVKGLLEELREVLEVLRRGLQP